MAKVIREEVPTTFEENYQTRLLEKTAQSLARIPVAILLGSALISLSLLLSSGLIQIKGLTPKTAALTGNQAQQVQPGGNPPQAPAAPEGPVKVSLDGDPTLGNADAPVTLIEFSDYECPFCKRHFDETYPQIKKEYIDTGKVKLVFRDFIAVPSHNPQANLEALAANCVGEKLGDAGYFKFHDAVLTKTQSNGQGPLGEDIYAIAAGIGADSADIKSCVESKKFQEEIDKDIADAGTIGAGGTPAFFIGKSDSSGTIEAVKIVGAQPYATFKAAIDQALSQ